MKKINLFFIILILSACTPQVIESPTVTLPPPTETLIPTPTLHPEFIALQNLIADSSQRFTLFHDGNIEDNGTVIPNLHVDQNGIINIIFNNEHVVIEPSQITFDDENGLTIEGYIQNENGEWVEVMSEAEQQMYADFDKYKQDLKQDIADGKYTVETDPEGNVTLTDAEGNIVFQNGSFEPLFLGQLIVENKMCKQYPEWTTNKIGPGLPTNPTGFLKGYLQPLNDAIKIFIDNRIIKKNPGILGLSYYFGNECWGNVRYAKEGQTDALMTWKDPTGKVLYEYVFLPPKE